MLKMDLIVIIEFFLTSKVHVRHTCEMGDDVIYGWQKHDGISYGIQKMNDKKNNLILTTEFLKNTTNGLKNGGDWIVRIKGQTQKTISLLFYIGTEDESKLKIGGMTGKKTKGLSNPIIIHGNQQDIGKFSLFIHDGLFCFLKKLKFLR